MTKNVIIVITIICGVLPTPAEITTSGTYASGGIFLINCIHGSIIYRTGRYHAIMIATGKAMINPIAHPDVNEIKLLLISPQNTPLPIIVMIDSVTTMILGKLLAVEGIKDKIVQNSIAVSIDITIHKLPGILSIQFDLLLVFSVIVYPPL